MKMLPHSVSLLAILFCLAAAPAHGAPKKKGGSAAAAKKADASNPAEALAPYINNLDSLLALRRPAQKSPKLAALFQQASGRLVTLRADLAAEREKAAEADRAKFDAAVATCDALSRALEERQKVLGDVKSSQAVQGSGKLEEGGRKDNLGQGIKGGDRAKAVGSVVERDRERDAAAKAAARAASSDDALTAMAANRWNKRSIELKKAVTDAYARVK